MSRLAKDTRRLEEGGKFLKAGTGAGTTTYSGSVDRDRKRVGAQRSGMEIRAEVRMATYSESLDRSYKGAEVWKSGLEVGARRSFREC